MQLLTIVVNGQELFAVSDPYDDAMVHEFGAGVSGLRAAVDFMNAVWLAEHAATVAGFAH